MKYTEKKLQKFYFLVLSVGFSITSSIGFAQGYGPEGRVLKDGEIPAPNAICQSYGYGNVMQTKCFEAEPNTGKRDTPKTARKIDLKDTVEAATSGEHRTVYTYRDRGGILHYTENVPTEYKKSAKVFKKGTIKNSTPSKMIAYPKELAGPAIPAENPSVGSKFSNARVPVDKGLSASGTKISSKKITKRTTKKTVAKKSNLTQAKKGNAKTTVKSNKRTTVKKAAVKNNVKKATVKKTTKKSTNTKKKVNNRKSKK